MIQRIFGSISIQEMSGNRELTRTVLERVKRACEFSDGRFTLDAVVDGLAAGQLTIWGVLKGTDLTAVPAICVLTVQSFMSEVGGHMSKFKNAKHFVSWLGLCPGTKISGGKVLDARSRQGKPRFALQLRQAAQSLHSSKGASATRDP